MAVIIYTRDIGGKFDNWEIWLIDETKSLAISRSTADVVRNLFWKIIQVSDDKNF